MRRIVVAAMVVALAAIVAGCSSAGTGKTGSGQLKVVAAENFWGNLAQQIGGSHVVVTSLISNPSADPHEFTSNVADQLAVAHAGLVIVNGAGYDDFMSKLLSASPSSHRVVLTLADERGGGLGAGNPNPNPHLWYDPQFADRAVSLIADALTTADPEDKAAFRSGAHRVHDLMSPLLHEVLKVRQQFAGTPVAYTERVPGLLLEELKTPVLTPPGFARSIEDGTDPSFADIAAMRKVLSDHKAKVLLYNSQAASPVTQQLRALAGSNGIPVVPVTETMPGGATFESWQLGQVRALAAALGGASG